MALVDARREHERGRVAVVTHVVIPVRDQLTYTAGIVTQLADQDGWERCWIFDNGSVDDTPAYLSALQERDGRFTVVDAPGLGIYSMWESGIQRARDAGADHVAVLNNDLRLAPQTIERLNAALDEHPDVWVSYPDYEHPASHAAAEGGIRYTSGTFRHDGMAGFCFMLRVAPLTWRPLIDPQFRWWGGDDDLAFEIEARGGRQARVLGLGVTHYGEGTARHHDGLDGITDLHRVVAKWSR